MDDELELTEEDEANPNIKQMRARIKELEKAEKTSAAIVRENALLKAGVDLNVPVGQLFAKGYDGKLEVADIVAAAEGIPGVIKSAEVIETPAETLIPPEEVTATAERQALANGAAPDAGITEHPKLAAQKVAEQVRADAGTREKAVANAFNSLVRSGMEGDQRALVGPHNQG